MYNTIRVQLIPPSRILSTNKLSAPTPHPMISRKQSPKRHPTSPTHPPQTLDSSISLPSSPLSSSSLSLPPSPSLFPSSFGTASCPITFSNWLHSASTDPNSFPTAMTPSSERLSLLMFARTCSRLWGALAWCLVGAGHWGGRDARRRFRRGGPRAGPRSRCARRARWLRRLRRGVWWMSTLFVESLEAGLGRGGLAVGEETRYAIKRRRLFRRRQMGMFIYFERNATTKVQVLLS